MECTEDERLAWRIWRAGGRIELGQLESPEKIPDLSFAADDGEGLVVTDEDELKKKAARYFAGNVLEPLLENPSQFFEEIHKVQHEKHALSGLRVPAIALGVLAEQGVDLFGLAAVAISEGSEPFRLLHLFSKSLPEIPSINVVGLFRFSDTIYEKTKNDYVGGLMNGPLENWLFENANLAQNIVEHFLDEPKEATSVLFRIALISILRRKKEKGLQKVLEFCEADNIEVARAAVLAVGFSAEANEATEEYVEKVINNLSDIIRNGRKELFFQCAIGLTAAVRKHIDKIGRLGAIEEEGSFEAKHVISRFLFLNSDEIKNRGDMERLLHFCNDVPAENNGTIENLDWVLSKLLKDKSWEGFVFQWITKWIGNQKSAVKLITSFDSLVSEAVKNKKMLFKWITEWLLCDEMVYPIAVQHLVSGLYARNMKEFPLSSDRCASLEIDDVLFLTRRILGFVYHQEPLVSMAWSIGVSRPSNDGTEGIIYSAFIEYIGEDFPGYAVEFLRKEAGSSEVDEGWRKLATRTADEIEGQLKKLNDLPRLKEMEVSDDKLRLLHRIKSEEMRRIQDEANKQSILSQIATTIPIKAGRGTFSIRDGVVSEPSMLTTISHEMAIPRREALDPAGAEISRIGFRTVKRGES